MKSLSKNEEKTNDIFFIPKKLFPLGYKKKLPLNPEDEILRKDVKSIEYIRDIMRFKSPTIEKHILNGNNFSKKLSKDLFKLSKTNDELNVNHFLSVEKVKTISPIKPILKDNESIKTIDSSTYHYNQLDDYYDKIEKAYNTQTSFFSKKKQNFPKLNPHIIKRHSIKNLYEVIPFNSKTFTKKKNDSKENNYSFSLPKEKEILGNKIQKNRVTTATTFLNSFSINNSVTSKNDKQKYFGYLKKVNKKRNKYYNNDISVDSFLKKKNDFLYYPESPDIDLNKKLKIGLNNIIKLSKGYGKFMPDENTKNTINNYLNTLPKEKFISKIENNKKIFVILDGTVILSHNYIKGTFCDIPTIDYLKKLNLNKRFKIYRKFLTDCSIQLNVRDRLDYIYLTDGTYIKDLIDIPKNEKCLILSFNWNFRGISFYNKKYQQEFKKKIKIEEKGNKSKLKKKYEFKKIKKKKKYLLNQSYTFGLDDIDDKEIYCYYSDTDEKRTKIKLLKDTLNISKYHHFAEYHNNNLNKKIENLHLEQMKKIKNFNSKQIDETSLKGLKKLIKNYNTIRGRENKISVNYMLNPPKTKKINIKRDFDTIKFYGIKTRDKLEQEIFDYKANYEYRADYEVEKNYPDLIAYNIPSILEDYPKLQRRELFDIFIQFKNLLKFCVSYSKNIDTIKSGIDFTTFVLCNRKINSQGRKLARKIFNAFNLIGNGYLNFDEYFIGLMHLRSKDLNQRYEIFLKIIDTDGNQKLSFYEVYDLSTASLKRTIGEDYSKDARDVIRNLGDFFAKLIFQLVDMPLNSEIPISLIKKKILEGGEAASYLEMLICADNFI